jgi:uncharacterized membrane protein (Fun14 family)
MVGKFSCGWWSIYCNYTVIIIITVTDVSMLLLVLELFQHNTLISVHLVALEQLVKDTSNQFISRKDTLM